MPPHGRISASSRRNLRDVFMAMASCRLNGEPAALLLHSKLRKCFSRVEQSGDALTGCLCSSASKRRKSWSLQWAVTQLCTWAESVRGSYLGSCRVLIEAQPGPRERFVLLWQLHHQRHPPVFIYWRYYGALPLPQVWVTRTWHNPRACFFFSSLRIFWRLFSCCSAARVDLRAWLKVLEDVLHLIRGGSHKVILFICGRNVSHSSRWLLQPQLTAGFPL